MKKLMLTLAVSLAFAPTAFAADAPAAKAGAMPAYGKDKPIPTPKIVKKTLANGMTVWVVPRQGLPRVDYVLAVRGAGYAADDSAHPGFASLLAGMINEGSARRDSRAIAEAAQGMGGSVAAGSSSDGISVQANAVASQAGAMMSLLAEVARTPSFPAKEVELAKANALQALRAAEATPRFRAERAINAAVYGEHPYGHTQPTESAINSVTQELLRTEHAKRFRPDRALLVITGRIGEAEAMKLAQAAFGDWKAEGPALAETAPAPRAANPARILLQRANSVQSTIRVGAPGIQASADELVPVRLASTILGGGFSSRVNINRREQKGYTYGASAGARMNRVGGAIVGGADVRNEVTGAA
jgi:zinc protease